MTIASKGLLFLDGDHLGLEDCNDEDDQVILSKRMLFLDGDHLGLEDCNDEDD